MYIMCAQFIYTCVQSVSRTLQSLGRQGQNHHYLLWYQYLSKPPVAKKKTANRKRKRIEDDDDDEDEDEDEDNTPLLRKSPRKPLRQQRLTDGSLVRISPPFDFRAIRMDNLSFMVGHSNNVGLLTYGDKDFEGRTKGPGTSRYLGYGSTQADSKNDKGWETDTRIKKSHLYTLSVVGGVRIPGVLYEKDWLLIHTIIFEPPIPLPAKGVGRGALKASGIPHLVPLYYAVIEALTFRRFRCKAK